MAAIYGGMIAQESAPSLTWRFPSLDHVVQDETEQGAHYLLTSDGSFG
jgi:hypothetical protein